MRRPLALALLVVLVLAAALAGRASVHAAGGVSATPVNGKAAGHGLRLWVHVFYAKGGNGHGHGPGGGGSVDCTNDDSQTGYAQPFATSGPVAFHANTSTFPAGLSSTTVGSALSASADTWNKAGHTRLLSVALDGTATAPSQDGVSELGWTRLAPKNALAATWTWTDATNRVVEADLFYNSSWPWAVLGSCPTSPTGKFDIADIGTHEMGHALGLNHFTDAGAQATMYPSAPPDEVRKTTLTVGDVTALDLAIGG